MCYVSGGAPRGRPAHACHADSAPLPALAERQRVFSLLQVSDQGDVLYVLPRNLRAVLASKSWWLRAQPAVKGVQEAAAYLVRVTFGTALVTSVVLVWVTILAILSSSSSDKDDRRWVGCGNPGLCHSWWPQAMTSCGDKLLEAALCGQGR